MADSVRNADLRFAPQLSIGVQWDGTIWTIHQKATEYLGPDLSIQKWLLDLFGEDPGGQTSKTFRLQSRMQDGQLQYHDVLALAKEWDALGPAQPLEFVAMLKLEVNE
jgi:hypothetical protein